MPVVRLLGPVDVLADDGRVSAPGSPLRRSILVLLALDAGRVVDAEQLLDQVWDGEPPSSGLRALRFHVSRLRADLGVEGLIVTVGAGYRLEASVDLSHVENSAEGPRDSGEIERLLGLWRGTPLADVAPSSVLEHEQQRLVELRLSLIEDLYRARVDEGDGAHVVGDLTRLCLDHPLREGLWASLITAHSQAGHQAEALRAYDRLRLHLAETLGVDPSPALQELERHVLHQDPDVLMSRTVGESAHRPAREPGNLPHPRTRLLGREQELAAVVELAGSHRLVSLVGVGGVGKTHLAVEAAHLLSSGFRDGAWFIELSTVRDDAEVSTLVASTLGIRPRAGRSIGEVVVETLAGQQVLVVLDNCEHVLDGVTSLVDRLLDDAAGVRIMATSREGLGVRGEQLMVVPGLRADGPGSPAVELFRRRAEEAGWLERTDQDELIAELCQRLDGMPLAIELAAARARSMAPADMLGRLDDRFRLLTGRRRGIARHQTLRATVSWSYDLLDPEEQQLFDRLSVFSGPFEFSAAERVCSGDGFDRADVDELIGSLVDKSMVVNTGTSLVLLETLRRYGQEQLARTGDSHRFRNNHLAHYVSFVMEAHDGLLGPDEVAWWYRLEGAWSNIRAAFRWAKETGRAEPAATIVAHLGGFVAWHPIDEQFDWAVELVEMDGAEELELYPSCLAVAAHGTIGRGDIVAGHERAARAVEVSRGPAVDVDQCPHWSLAYSHQVQGHVDLGAELYSELAQRAGQLGRPVEQSCFLAGAALTLGTGEQLDDALALARQARALAEPTGNPLARSFTLATEAGIWFYTDPAHSLKLTDRALALAGPAQVEMVTFTARQYRALCLRRLGHDQQAVAVACELVRSSRRQGAWTFVGLAVGVMAGALEALDHPEPAAELAGFASTMPWASVPVVQAQASRLRQRLESRIGSERLTELTETGRQLSPHQAADLAEHAADLARTP